MKKLITLLAVALCVPVLSMAQYSEKIQAAFTPAEIEAIVAADPNEMLFLEYMADRSATMQKRRGDISAMPEISELNDLRKNENIAEINAENFNIETFNPLAYDLELENTVQYFRIGDTDNVVQILSKRRTRHLFDNGH